MFYKYILLFLLFLNLLIGIGEYHFALIGQNQCDQTDKHITMSLHDYLATVSMVDIGISGALVLSLCEKHYIIGVVRTLLFIGIFYITWFVYGGIALFASNMQCMQEGTTLAMSTLIAWFLLFKIFYYCHVILKYGDEKYKKVQSEIDDGSTVSV